MRRPVDQFGLAIILIGAWSFIMPAGASAPQDSYRSGTLPRITRGSSSATETSQDDSRVPSTGQRHGQLIAPPSDVGSSLRQDELALNQRRSIADNSVESRNATNGARPLEPGANATGPAEDDGATADEEEAASSDGLLLAPPSKRKLSGGVSKGSAGLKGSQLQTTFFSLMIVLASFFVLVWFLKRTRPGTASQVLPSEAVEILGRTGMDAKQDLRIVRFGPKLLLLAVTQTSAQTLGEISDPAEVDRIAQLCESNRNGSISDTFRQVLAQIGNEPSRGGFLGTEANGGDDSADASRSTRRSRRWF